MATHQSNISPRVLDLTGQRFHRLVVQHFSHISRRQAYWTCQCDCGKLTVVSSTNLRNKTRPVTSCGCFFLQRMKETFTTHGYSRTPLYAVWRSMIARCHRPSDSHYPRYGARGIYVCERWRHSFAAFLEDMGEPGENLQLERRDNNGPYSPNNCLWASLFTQANNKRNNRLLTWNDETHTVAEWSRITGLLAATLFSRIYRHWSIEDILTIPPAHGKYITRKQPNQLGAMREGTPPAAKESHDV